MRVAEANVSGPALFVVVTTVQQVVMPARLVCSYRNQPYVNGKAWHVNSGFLSVRMVSVGRFPLRSKSVITYRANVQRHFSCLVARLGAL